MVGLGRLELPTSPLSGARSSHLSYRPLEHGRNCEQPVQFTMPSVESQPSTNTDFARPTLMQGGKVHNLEVERILIAPIARGTKRFAEIAGEFLFASEILT
jgi:hypothetical protein